MTSRTGLCLETKMNLRKSFCVEATLDLRISLCQDLRRSLYQKNRLDLWKGICLEARLGLRKNFCVKASEGIFVQIGPQVLSFHVGQALRALV